MIDKKSIIIGLIVSVVLVVSLGYVLVAGPFIGVLAGAIIAAYLANRKNPLKVVESALHGILVGIFTGVVQILILYAKSGFAANIVGILIIGAGVIIGAYIIVGALGGIVGTLAYVKFGGSYKKSDMELMELEDQPEQQ
jgi:ABC-type transport system involved in multi-copper enzyme maturation permease subunit